MAAGVVKSAVPPLAAEARDVLESPPLVVVLVVGAAAVVLLFGAARKLSESVLGAAADAEIVSEVLGALPLPEVTEKCWVPLLDSSHGVLLAFAPPLRLAFITYRLRSAVSSAHCWLGSAFGASGVPAG